MDTGVFSSQRVKLTSGKEPSASVGYEAGWASEPIWMLQRREKPPAPTENQRPILQPIIYLLY
jgi:hypothetical protein